MLVVKNQNQRSVDTKKYTSLTKTSGESILGGKWKYFFLNQ